MFSPYSTIIFCLSTIKSKDSFCKDFPFIVASHGSCPATPRNLSWGGQRGKRGNNGFYYKTVCGALNRTFLTRVNGCFYSRYDC